jgi:hypothetical protein
MSQKRIWIYLAVLAAIGAAIWWLASRQTQSTLSVEETDFSLDDTTQVDKIFLADRDDHKITLTKNDRGVWRLNGKRRASGQRVSMLLETMYYVEVKGPVPSKARETVIKNLSSSSIKAEFYDGEQLLKTVYVGGTTPDNLGTYMWIEGAEHPYITHIPGFYGYLTIRFTPNARDWRSRKLFSFNPADIQTVRVTFPAGETPGYRLDRRAIGEYRVEALPPLEKQYRPVDELQVKKYLANLNDVALLDFVSQPNHLADSLGKALPEATVFVQLEDNRSEKLYIYRKRAGKRTKGISEEGYDKDVAFGIRSAYPTEVFTLSREQLPELIPPPKYYLKAG